MSTEKETFDFLLNCIRHALTGAAPELSMCTDETLNAACRLARRHHLLHLVFGMVQDWGALAPDRREKLQRTALFQVTNELRQQAELQRITELFNTNGIDFIPLKGSVLKSCYPQPWMRFSADIDVLVRKETLETAAAVLVNGGFRRVRDGSHCIEFMNAGNTVGLELHYRLINNVLFPQTAALLETVWDAAENTENHRYDLPPEWFYLYHLAHMAVHVMKGGCGIRQVIDVWVINRYMSPAREKLAVLLKQTELTDFEAAVRRLAEDWMLGTYRRENDAMTEYILSGGLFGRAEAGYAMAQARGGGKLRNMLRRVFLPFKEMRYRYPVLNRAPVLLPWCYLRYWWWAVTKGKLRSGKRILQENMSISKAQRAGAEQVIRAFGLETKR